MQVFMRKISLITRKTLNVPVFTCSTTVSNAVYIFKKIPKIYFIFRHPVVSDITGLTGVT